MTKDIISQTLTKIRNSSNAKNDLVEINFTQLTKNIVIILKKEGFINNFEIMKDSIIVTLKYYGKEKTPVINLIERVSKPGLKVYLNKKHIPKMVGSFGISIISTSKGLLTGEEARMLNVGGEIVCKIY